ncbi:MAG TPA: hypothetical protein VHS96_15605 [Bacteroidia bacterium]|nr:hypothetical protein [Bacteroidia bacterium]
MQSTSAQAHSLPNATMKTWTNNFSRIWIGLLLVSFSTLAIAQNPGLQYSDAERDHFRQLGMQFFERGNDSGNVEYFRLAEQSLLKCTENQFAKAKIQELLEENRKLIPCHPQRIRFLSKLIPGFGHFYLGESGKALGNLALVGGIVASTAIFWPVGLQFGVFALIDWLAQGSKRAVNQLDNATKGRRKEILKEILVLSLAPN